MNLQTYIPAAVRTEAPTQNMIDAVVNDSGMVRSLHSALGIATEIGELWAQYNSAKKPKKMDMTNVREEIGDAFWYCAIYVDVHGLDLTLFNEFDTPGKKRKYGKLLRELSVRSADLLDTHKKALFYGKPYKKETYEDQFIWVYKGLTDLCHTLGFDPAEIRTTNIAKLQARYPEKFDSDAAINRDLETERAVLDGGH